MTMSLTAWTPWLAVATPLLPLAGSLFAGVFGNAFSLKAVHRFLIALVGIAFIFACVLAYEFVILDHAPYYLDLYTWASAGALQLKVAFYLDRLSTVMSVIVLFVSFAVHVYTIGYMADDDGYRRFFSYVSLFTFSMLMLVFAGNFLVLFFGWEGVGLVSYLLIGYWFKRDSATAAGLKAFLVNRLADIGFLLGTASVLYFFGSLEYPLVLSNVESILNQAVWLTPTVSISAATLIGGLFFIGAMGKSAQVPLHVWLPESMEGPTPISALIHAATMVTAGIYMIARLSPIVEYSETLLTSILIIGGTTALFMGILAIVQNDIKRVIAYSTLSQLGYMVVALGASAYDAAIFHLITHAFFKALLFLAAGSVIVALHHEHDMRKMGGLASYMPITYVTFLIGSLALCAFPPFSGFFSKDIIIEAVGHSRVPGAAYAHICVLIGVFFTALYTFRALFLTFHTKPRVDSHTLSHVHESPAVIWVPLVLLAIPSMIAGVMLVQPMLFADVKLLSNSIFVLPKHDVLHELATHFHGVNSMMAHAGASPSFWLSVFGAITAVLCFARHPNWAAALSHRFRRIYHVLQDKYGFDRFYDYAFVRGSKRLGHLFYDKADVIVIDSWFVNGLGAWVRKLASVSKPLQTGFIYHYALVMLLGILIGLVWFARGF